MDKLSTEVLLIIFKDFQLEEKLECMRVCRVWANLLRDGLFESIVISNETSFKASDKYITRLIKKAKTGTRRGKNCRSLRLYSYTRGKAKGEILATTFPNLKFLYYHFILFSSLGSHYFKSSTVKPDPFQGWKDSLETIIDRSYGCNFVKEILETGIFKRLTTLMVNPPACTSDVYSLEFVKCLKNAPALTSLDTEFSGPSINYLEELHKNTPELVSLTLGYRIRSEDHDLDPLTISPAKKLKILRLRNFQSKVTYQEIFFAYMKLKYTFLHELSFENKEVWNYWPDIPGADWSSVLATIGPNLMKLELDLPYDMNWLFDSIVQIVDRLKSLAIYVKKDTAFCSRLLQNKRFHGLSSLSLINLPLSGIDLGDFKGLKNLKELHFSFQRFRIAQGEVSLEGIMEKLPKSLEKLCIEDAKLIMPQRTVEGLSSVSHLKLIRAFCQDENFSSFFNQHFPKLYTLVLDDCLLCDTLELPNRHLYQFEYRPAISPSETIETCPYSFIGAPNTKLIHLQLTTQNQTRYYNFPIRENDCHEYTINRFALHNDLHLWRILKASKKDGKLKYFQFKCAAIDTLYFKDCILQDYG